MTVRLKDKENNKGFHKGKIEAIEKTIINNSNSFFKQWFSYGLICHASYNQIKEIQDFLQEHNIDIVFDKVSLDSHLWIVEKERGD